MMDNDGDCNGDQDSKIIIFIYYWTTGVSDTP